MTCLMASATILIDAPGDRVMAHLLAFSSYPAWCPFTEVMDARGRLARGTTIVEQVRLSPADSSRRETHVRVSALSARAIEWTSIVGHPCLLLARRTQVVTDEPPAAPGGAPRARYTTVDALGGALAPLVRFLYGAKIAAGLASVAAALKARAEAG